MRCPLCLEGDALDLLEYKKIDDKRYPVYICMCCDAVGSKKELEMQSAEIIDGRYAYFYCPELSIGLFYRQSYWSIDPRKFSAKMWVQVPDMDKGTEIQFMGVGQSGYDKMHEQELRTQSIFPVNLFRKNRILQPRPSRTVSEAMVEEWRNITRIMLP